MARLASPGGGGHSGAMESAPPQEQAAATRRLNVLEGDSAFAGRGVLKRIIRTQQSLITRLYTHIRFRIIPLRFLQEMGQYIPRQGSVLDIGCGFGLFTLYFAAMHPQTRFYGIDLSARRIDAARASARKLGITNAQFECRTAQAVRQADLPRFDLVVTLDVLHHLPVAAGDELLRTIYDELLADGSLLLIKDITTRPRYMLYFTYLLDLLMNPRDSFYYRSAERWMALLREIGFERLEQHYLWDLLPYPHVLLLARKGGSAP